MRYIDLETWPRREQFKLFSTMDYPHFNLCANVTLTAFYPAVKQREVSITVALVYVFARTANAIPEFRCRIREEAVVEHAIVHPAMTVPTAGDLFGFCAFSYTEDFSAFAADAAKRIAVTQAQPSLKDLPDQDDLLYMTAVPWVTFTSCVHPYSLSPVDSVPRIAWGKFFSTGEDLQMPLSVQAHHALMDGIHVGRFYAAVQDCLDHPDAILGEMN